MLLLNKIAIKKYAANPYSLSKHRCTYYHVGFIAFKYWYVFSDTEVQCLIKCHLINSPELYQLTSSEPIFQLKKQVKPFH